MDNVQGGFNPSPPKEDGKMIHMIIKKAVVTLVTLLWVSSALAIPYSVVGDVNGDGLVNTTDARLIQRCSVGNILCIGFCDVNSDGKCNTTDARLIQLVTVSNIEFLPSDQDGDGVYDVHDNCVEDKNPMQLDRDNDGRGDACENDPAPGTGSHEVYAVTPSEVFLPGEKVYIVGRGFGELASRFSFRIKNEYGESLDSTVTVVDVKPHILVAEVQSISPMTNKGGRARYDILVFMDGKLAKAAKPESTGVYLRATGSAKASEQISLQVIQWGEYDWRPKYPLWPGIPRCEGQPQSDGVVRQIWHVDDQPPYSGSVSTSFFPSRPIGITTWAQPTGNDDWKAQGLTLFNDQEYAQASRDWQSICGNVWVPELTTLIGGFAEVAPRISIVSPWYYRLRYSVDSKEIWALSRGLMYKPNTNSAERNCPFSGFTGCPWVPEGEYTPCNWVWPTGSQNCSSFIGTRSDRILVSIHRTFVVNGVEIDPDNPVTGFRAVVDPVSSFGEINGLILIAANPCFGCTPLPRCDGPSSPPNPANRYEANVAMPPTPNLLAHEIGHVVAGTVLDENTDFSVMVSFADIVRRGYVWDTTNPQASRLANCHDALSRPHTR